MDNFLSNNQDYSYSSNNLGGSGEAANMTPVTQTPAVQAVQPKAPKKKRRAALAITAGVLVMALGFGGGVAGTIAAARITGSNFSSGISVNGNENAPQIPEAVLTDNISESPRFFQTVDTLAVNSNKNKLSPEELFEVVKDGVVGIEITYRVSGNRMFGSGYEQTQLVGTGFVFTTDGYVLTNDHVVADAVPGSITVVVNDYKNPAAVNRYAAELVGTDSSTDLAVLKISRAEEFMALPIGESSSLKVGTFVCAIGFPLGMEKSMTYGIVSGLNREMESGGYELSSIQIDAAVNSGNSGGPLFDMYGNVVGIVNKKLVYENLVENMGFAITIDEAKPVINDLLLHGTVTSRPMLGISSGTLNEYTAALYGFDITEGILVQGIFPKAPAYKSDLAVGDIIVEVNGVSVATVTDVQTQIKNNRPGDVIELTVVRYSETGSQKRIVIAIELANSAELE